MKERKLFYRKISKTTFFVVHTNSNRCLFLLRTNAMLENFPTVYIIWAIDGAINNFHIIDTDSGSDKGINE